VDARSADPEERVSRIAFATIGSNELGMVAQSLEPRVTLGTNAVLLEELALEGLRLWKRRGYRGYAAGGGNLSSNESDLAALVAGERRKDLESPAGLRRNGAKNHDPRTGSTKIHANVAKLARRHSGDVVQRHGEAVRSPSHGF
jgi:hypothetical protein